MDVPNISLMIFVIQLNYVVSLNSCSKKSRYPSAQPDSPISSLAHTIYLPLYFMKNTFAGQVLSPNAAASVRNSYSQRPILLLLHKQRSKSHLLYRSQFHDIYFRFLKLLRSVPLLVSLFCMTLLIPFFSSIYIFHCFTHC